MNKLKKICIIAAGVLMMGASLLCAPTVWAEPQQIDVNPSENAKKALTPFKDSSGGDTMNAEDFTQSLMKIFQFIFSIMGIVAVVVIMLGGFHFLTSTGDPGKVKKGKDTMIWGIIGLLVVIFSFAIVNFILDRIANN